MKLPLKGAAIFIALLFTFFNLSGSESLLKYYGVFYQKAENYDKWLNSDKNDLFKDIFIALYNLPDKKKRKFNRPLKLKELNSLSDSSSYGYLYLDFDLRASVEIVFYGVKRGEITVNGASRGKISLTSDLGFAVLKGVFEKGVYFVSLKILEKNEGVPIVVLSNKTIKQSENRGFTKDALSNLTVKNYDDNKNNGAFTFLYKTFCFPYLSEDSKTKEIFFALLERNLNTIGDKDDLIALISLSNINKGASETLKKIGFSKDSLNWWQTKFFERRVCYDE